MENSENSFKIDQIRHINLPYIQGKWRFDELVMKQQEWQAKMQNGLSYWRPWP